MNRYHEAMIAAAGPDCRTKLLDTRKVSLVFFLKKNLQQATCLVSSTAPCR